MCLVSLCVLRLTNFGFVQCSHLGSLWNFARVCFYVLRASPRKHRVCAVLFPLPFPLEFVRLCLPCVLCLTNISFVHCLFSRLPFKFTSLYWSCFVVRVFRFTWFVDIRLVNAGFVVVAGCFYSPGSACYTYLFLCFNICRFAISCVICIHFGVLLFPFILLL